MIAPDADASIEFTVTSSVADAFAAELPTNRARIKRKARARWFAGFALVFLLSATATGISSNPADPMAFFKTLRSAKMGLVALTDIGAIIAIMAGMMFGTKAINRALRRWVLIDSRRRHPAVDTNDPALPITCKFRFDETGMTTSTAVDEVWESWRRITGLDETADLLVLRAGGILNFPIPKAQLPPELRERLQRYVDSRSHSKWPF